MPEAAIHVSVTFLGLVRDQMGRGKLDLELPAAATYQDLLDSLAPLADERLGEWAWDRKRHDFTDRVRVSRGARIAMSDKSSLLVDGEEIIVFPPLAGG